MRPIVYKKFEEILSKFEIKGRILEVGATPNKGSLLSSSVLSSSTEKIGINLDGPNEFEDFKIIRGNSNNMEMFQENYFDCVLCNATLEHDNEFWKSISEMKRVLKINGLLIIGTPSFVKLKMKTNFLSKLIILINLKSFINMKAIFKFLKDSTFCFKVHNAPGDYYRFSEQTFKEVFFRGFKNLKIETVMIPPITVGYGFKK